VAAEPPADVQPIFYYDLGNPQCYLVAEQIMAVLPVVPEWEPVHAAALGIPVAELDRDAFARRAAELELQPLRWPPRWPPDTREVMLAATYAKRVGRAVAFSLAAFRQEFAGGRDLGDRDSVLIAAAAAEMHPAAVLKGIALRSVEDALAQACARASAAAVSSLPAIELADRLVEGDHALERAGALLAEVRA
jgi:2-hydroxychromene-2-carboxylate isomerase